MNSEVTYAIKTVDNLVVICVSNKSYLSDVIERLVVNGIRQVMTLENNVLVGILRKPNHEFIATLPFDHIVAFYRNPTTTISEIEHIVAFKRVAWCG